VAGEKMEALKRRAMQVAEAVIPRPAANTLGARGVAGLNSLMPGGGSYEEELARYNATAPGAAGVAFDVASTFMPGAKVGALGIGAVRLGALRRATERIISPRVAARLEKLAKAGGGFTHPAAKSGFAFSASPENEEILADLTSDAIRDYAKRHSAALARPHARLGAWHDGEKWYLDVSTVVPDRESALREAARAGQRAIYDLGKGESINVP
jgi:hypothetical protein